MDPFKKVVDWAASTLIAAFSVITLARIEAAVQLGVGVATIAMCVCAVRLSILRRRALERQLKREEYVLSRTDTD